MLSDMYAQMFHMIGSWFLWEQTFVTKNNMQNKHEE